MSMEWATRLTISLWHGVLIMWDLRNRAIHGTKGYTQSFEEKRRLLREAQELLEVGLFQASTIRNSLV